MLDSVSDQMSSSETLKLVTVILILSVILMIIVFNNLVYKMSANRFYVSFCLTNSPKIFSSIKIANETR